MLPVASVVLNAVVMPLCIIAWLQLALGDHKDPKMLAARGVGSLKYFTVLSNLFSALVSVAYLVAGLCFGARVDAWMLSLKLVATTSVMLTFLTVMVLLNPIYGWRRMYASGNLWLHLVLPLIALVDCCLYVSIETLSWQSSLLGMLPTIVYGVFYLRNIVLHGAEEDGEVYDFYGFLRWGKDKIPLVMVGMLLASWLIALGVYGLSVLI